MNNKTLTNILVKDLNFNGGDWKENTNYVLFDGKIGEVRVTYGVKTHRIFSDIRLVITKPNGESKQYVNRFGSPDINVDEIIIKDKEGNTRRVYDKRNAKGTRMMERAQKELNIYLQKIKEIKFNQGLEGLKYLAFI